VQGGITLRAAALRLGISEKTLRAKIKAGEIQAQEVRGKFNKEWRVFLPDDVPVVVEEGPALEPGKEGEVSALGTALGEGVQAAGPAVVPVEVFSELLQRHEAATVRLGYLQAQSEQVKALKATEEELRAKAAQQEERARLEAEARRQAEQKANEEAAARRKAEEELERVRLTLGATEAALEGERSKPWLRRLFNR
jgi:hypothetical protein